MSFELLPHWTKEQILFLLIDRKDTYRAAICVCKDFHDHLSIMMQIITSNNKKKMNIVLSEFTKIIVYTQIYTVNSQSLEECANLISRKNIKEAIIFSMQILDMDNSMQNDSKQFSKSFIEGFVQALFRL
uniref:Uncharacterized protein n=1 Tax=viral metagenome TaxID=1070528 RepID=A0A6C0LR34_9ZZZZ